MIDVWVTVYVFSIVECVAPIGKTICERKVAMDFAFLDSVECTTMLDMTIEAYAANDRAILVEEPVCRSDVRLQGGAEYDKKDELLKNMKEFPAMFDGYRSSLWKIYNTRKQ